MIEDVKAEPVSGKKIAAVIDRVKRPVLAEFLRAQNHDAVIAEFVVLDDRQGFKGFAEADTVGDDAAVVLFDLVNCAEYAVPLKAV